MERGELMQMQLSTDLMKFENHNIIYYNRDIILWQTAVINSHDDGPNSLYDISVDCRGVRTLFTTKVKDAKVKKKYYHNQSHLTMAG